MIWLVLSIFVDFVFVQLFKVGQRRGLYSPTVVTMNYLIVAVSIFLYLIVTDQFTLSYPMVLTGLVTGVAFISAMLTITHSFEIAPAGAVFTANRMSVAVPVAMGVWVWNEPIDVEQIAGISLAFLALAMMTSGIDGSKHTSGPRALGLFLAILFLQGLSHTCLRSVHYNGLDDAFLQVLMITGATAGTIGCTAITILRRRPRADELKLGGFIGLYNALALCVIMTALSKLPGTLFFPVVGCSVVLLDNLTAHFFWRERLNRIAAAGVAVAALAIVLVV